MHSSVPLFVHSAWVTTDYPHYHAGPPGPEKLNYGAVLNRIWKRLAGR